MIEVIPNWHPMAVHFPIALVCISAFFFLCGVLFKSKVSSELFIASKWCLWGAALTSVIAALLGWQAYNTVAHDEASHAAMTLHRNWAIPTAIYIALIAVFAIRIRHEWGAKNKTITLLLLVIGCGLISTTGWLGAEAVYRHGIGVMRIPSADDHAHSNSSDHGNMNKMPHHEPEESQDATESKEQSPQHHEGHDHAH